MRVSTQERCQARYCAVTRMGYDRQSWHPPPEPLMEDWVTETFTIVNSQLSMVAALEAVQRAAFPTLVEDEIITAAHYAAHIARFPEGQFAVLNAAGQVVACSTDFRTSAVDFNVFEHRYIDAVAYNWLSRHDPQGEWLY